MQVSVTPVTQQAPVMEELLSMGADDGPSCMTMDQSANPVGAPITLVDAIENILNVQHQLEDMDVDNIPFACDSPFTPVPPAGK